MEGFDGGDGIDGNPNPNDLREFGDGSSDNTRFDASQYAFFGKDVLEEVELGGLEDDQDDAALVGFEDDEYRFSSLGDREEEFSDEFTFQLKRSNDGSFQSFVGVYSNFGLAT